MSSKAVEVAEAAGESRSRMLESLALLRRMQDSFQANAPDDRV
jgi:hypothetical protein